MRQRSTRERALSLVAVSGDGARTGERGGFERRVQLDGSSPAIGRPTLRAVGVRGARSLFRSPTEVVSAGPPLCVHQSIHDETRLGPGHGRV